MMNILLIGCLGRLGSEISDLVSDLESYQIIAGLDLKKDRSKKLTYNVYNQIQDIIDGGVIADVAIDFSNPSSLQPVINYCLQTATPLVLGTTDLSESDKKFLLNSSQEIPVFWSVNMSFGVNVLADLCKKMISLVGDDCEIDILEKHHRNKIDAPSGTASLIANLIKLQSDRLYGSQKTICNNNFCLNKSRSKNEIRVYSIRSGSMAGSHDIILNIGDETITLSHISFSTKIFAKGAIKAADFIINQKPGLYGALNDINIK